MKKAMAYLLTAAILLAGCSAPAAASTGNAPTASASGSAPAAGTASEGWIPTKDIEMVIPFSAGGGSDIFARKLIEIIQKNQLCPVNIVPTNKPGGSGVVGYSYMSAKGKDNYVLATTSSSFYSQPLTGNSPLSCYDSFSFVSHLCKDPTLLAANAKRDFTSLQDIIDFAKANPGVLKYGGTGNISDDAILMHMINVLTDIELIYVPYDSGAEVLAAILGGHIDLCGISPAEAGEHLVAGTLTPIAVSADDRLSIIPEVPTFLELGVEINHQQSRGVVMNAGIPEEVVKYYSELFKKVSETEEWQSFLTENVMAKAYMDYKEYQKFNDRLADNYKTYFEIINQN